MEEQAENRNKRKLNIDWGELLPGRNDDVPAELIVKKSGPPTPAQKSVPMSDDPGSGEELDREIPDQELGVRIARMKETYSKVRHCLPDKGKKILATVTRLEKECERRRLAGAVPVCVDIDGCDKLTQSPSSDASDCFTQRTPSPQIQSKSSFTSVFREKMEENRDCREANAFDKELSILAHCDCRKMRSDGDLSQRGRQKVQSSSRKWPFHKGDKSFNSNGSQKDRASLTCPSHETGENLSSCLPKKKDSFEVLPSKNPRPRKEHNFVLLDEDESPVEDASEESEGSLHVETTEQADEFAECMIDAKIYYPSRVDPESVEICYTDINHLAPAAYLTSPIMNFYIRYLQLQASPTNRAIRDCHLFNTYFYSKLKEAVSQKGGDKDSFFIKFRRWWKGVNIFQKSYVLIPIHEDGIQKQISTSSAARRVVAYALIKISFAYTAFKRIYEGFCLTRNLKQPSYLVALIDWLWARIICAILWPLHLLAEKLVYKKIQSAIGISKAGVSGGGSLPMHIDLFYEAIGVKVQVGYGLTESSPVIAARRPACNVLGSVGRPIKHTEIKIVDAETNEVLPAGSKGIVKVRGSQVMKGYYKNPSATKQALDEDGWLNTGDIGWIAPHHSRGRSRRCGGVLVLEGRAKDTIVLSTGENVEPLELEEAALRSSLIRQIVVIGQDQRRPGAIIVPDKEEVLMAAKRLSIVHADAPELSKEKTISLLYGELRKWTSKCSFQIGPILVVDEPFTIDSGLMTPTMKIRRDRVAAQFEEEIENLYK